MLWIHKCYFVIVGIKFAGSIESLGVSCDFLMQKIWLLTSNTIQAKNRLLLTNFLPLIFIYFWRRTKSYTYTLIIILDHLSFTSQKLPRYIQPKSEFSKIAEQFNRQCSKNTELFTSSPSNDPELFSGAGANKNSEMFVSKQQVWYIFLAGREKDLEFMF